MTTEERKHEILIFISMAKMLSDQSTMLIGEFKLEKKYRFNLAMNALDALIKSIETDINEYNKETLQILADSMNDGIANLRKELKEAK